MPTAALVPLPDQPPPEPAPLKAGDSVVPNPHCWYMGALAGSPLEGVSLVLGKVIAVDTAARTVAVRWPGAGTNACLAVFLHDPEGYSVLPAPVAGSTVVPNAPDWTRTLGGGATPRSGTVVAFDPQAATVTVDWRVAVGAADSEACTPPPRRVSHVFSRVCQEVVVAELPRG